MWERPLDLMVLFILWVTTLIASKCACLSFSCNEIQQSWALLQTTPKALEVIAGIGHEDP